MTRTILNILFDFFIFCLL